MSEPVKAASKLLDYLVLLRKLAVEKNMGIRGAGILGVLLADKKGVLSGCVFCPPSHCCPAPQTLKDILNKAIALGYKKSMKPVGVVVLNPDEGIRRSGDKFSVFVGSGDYSKEGFKDSRAYTLFRLSRLLKSFSLSPYLVIVDTENRPVYLEITPQSLKDVDPYDSCNYGYWRTFLKELSYLQASRKKQKIEFLSVAPEVSDLINAMIAEEGKQEEEVVK